MQQTVLVNEINLKLVIHLKNWNPALASAQLAWCEYLQIDDNFLMKIWVKISPGASELRGWEP